jgi:adenine nucleotide transporter 17
MRNKYIAKQRTNPGPLSNLAIASAAGCVNVMCTIPIWTITTRMQARRKKMESAGGRRGRAGKKKSGKSLLSSSWAAEGKETDDDEDEGESMKGFLATAREVWNDGGAAGFWQGVVPSLVMVSNPAMQYGAFIFLVSVRAIGLTGKCFLFNSALRDSRRRVQARQA